MQFAKEFQANWQEGYCFILKKPDPIQHEQPSTEFKNYSGNFLNIGLTARTLLIVTSICYYFGGKRFADGEEVETEVRKWLRQQ
jgi:hypothetical protein